MTIRTIKVNFGCVYTSLVMDFFHLWLFKWQKWLTCFRAAGVLLLLCMSWFWLSCHTFSICDKEAMRSNLSLLLLVAGVGGYSYLYEPLWWVGMITSESEWVTLVKL